MLTQTYQQCSVNIVKDIKLDEENTNEVRNTKNAL